MRSAHHSIFFTWADLKRLFLRHRIQLKWAALLGGIAVCALLLLSSPKYKLEASFKLASKQKEISVNMKEVFQQLMDTPQDSGAIAIFQSNQVIGAAIEQLGMQVEWHADFLVLKALKRIRDNLRAEVGAELADVDDFRFSDVKYTAEKPRNFFLKLKDSASYQLFDGDKQMIGEGKLGQQVTLPSGHFTLSYVPARAKPGQMYRFTIKPLHKTIKLVRGKLKIFPHRLDKNILQLAFHCRDRELGATFLNCLMLSYQNFLRRENEEITQKQLDYLEKRQEELTKYYDKALSEHTAYLHENLAKDGYIGFAQEIETLSEPKNFYTSKLFDIGLELKRISDNRFLTSDAKEKLKEEKHLQDKKKADRDFIAEERKQLQVQMENCAFEQLKSNCSSVHASDPELIKVNAQLTEATQLLQSLEKREEIPPTPALLQEPKSALAQLIKQIIAHPLEEETSLSRLKEMIAQLTQKRETLEEDLQLQLVDAAAFSGINLETAQSLLVEYTRQRDSLQAQMRELVFLREQLSRSDFQMSSLGGVFEDDVTRDIVAKASAIALQLKDENNRSMREQERLVETLQTQKNFLSHYLFQVIELKRLRAKLLGDKIASLQTTIVSLLKTEQGLLENKLSELNVKMADLPEKWRRESLLMLKKELGAAMLEGISQLAETKSLTQHTFHVTSKPLDFCIPPVSPQAPRIVLFTLFAALVSAGCYFVALFGKGVFQGLPASAETLKLCGFPVSGKMSPYCSVSLSEQRDRDLDVLRHLSEFVISHVKHSEALIALSIRGNNPNFTSPLAELLSIKGLKPLIIRCGFNQVVRPEETPGQWQYLQGLITELPIRREGIYDYIHCGGTSRHGLDLLTSPKFYEALSALKKNYDIILLDTTAHPAAMEAISLLKIANVAIITVQQETQDQLDVYLTWSQQNSIPKATFVCVEEFG